MKVVFAEDKKKDEVRELVFEAREMEASQRFSDARSRLKEARRKSTQKGDREFLDALLSHLDYHELLTLGYHRVHIKSHLDRAFEHLTLAKSSPTKIYARDDIEGEEKRFTMNAELAKNETQSPTIVEATTRLAELIQNKWTDHILWTRYGQFLTFLDQRGEARIALLRACSLDPDWHVSFVSMGNVFFRLKQYEKAIEWLELGEAIARRQGVALDAAARNTRALSYYYLGDFRKAISIFEKAAEGQGGKSDFWGNLGFTMFRRYFRNGGIQEVVKHASELEEYYGKAILDTGLNSTAHFNLAILFYLFEKDRKQRFPSKVRPEYGSASRILARTAQHLKDDNLDVEALVTRCLGDISRLRTEPTPHDLLFERVFLDIENFITADQDLRRLHTGVLTRQVARPLKQLQPNHVCILKKWGDGSYLTPRVGLNRGGGFFVRWNGKGILIDPGRNFLRFFVENGYVISDINSVFLTSSSYERLADLEGLLELYQEYRSRFSTTARLKVYAVPGALLRLGEYIYRLECIEQLSVLSPEMNFRLSEDVEVFATRCFSRVAGTLVGKDQTDLGLVLRLSGAVESGETSRRLNEITLGYVGRTGYSDKLLDYFGKADCLVLPVGRIAFREFLAGEVGKKLFSRMERYVGAPRMFDLNTLGFQSAAHLDEVKRGLREGKTDVLLSGESLGFNGALRLTNRTNSATVILTDLAVELGNLRHMVADVLNQVAPTKKFLTGDIGLRVSLDESGAKVFCDYEQDFVDSKGVVEFSTNTADDTILHVCKVHTLSPKFERFLELPR